MVKFHQKFISIFLYGYFRPVPKVILVLGQDSSFFCDSAVVRFSVSILIKILNWVEDSEVEKTYL